MIPLFFFCSGFFFSHSAKLTFFQYIRKLLFHLVVPYLFFTAFSALLFFTAEKCGMETGLRLPGPMNLVLMTCAGMRDYLFLPASWFFPALFCLSAAAFIARRFAEKISEKAAVRNGILLGIGVVCWIFSVFCRAFFLTHEVMGRRGLCLPWCLDWGLMFFFYYILGSILFPWLCEFHFARLSQAKKFLWGTVCGLSMLYVVLCIAFPGFGTFGLPDPTRHTFLFFLY